MCGLVGGWSLGSFAALRGALPNMTGAIAHRGPDDFGTWESSTAGVAIGHRRLSIVDLSPAGHQPMTSTDGRYVIAFNGEIYNHHELRAELANRTGALAWRGRSDTETLLAGFETWGVEGTLKKTVGMFAIALWDVRDSTLHLARDRFGEKPLYYGWVGSGAADNRAFVFGSELKALRPYPGFENAVCREALTLYMRFGYVPAPRSIYRDIFKLEPGCLLTIRGRPPAAAPATPWRPDGLYENLSLRRWWSLSETVDNGSRNLIMDENEAVDTLESRLFEAVKLQSLADVPLGAFLSGGVDSSMIVALMQRASIQPVRTFTVGFEEAGFDESPNARAVAQHLGTQHNELFVTAAEARALIPSLPTIYDEPFADSSQIPTHLVCRAARQHVTVALSGDAGDELFGGYTRYFWGERIWRTVAFLPYSVRQALSAALAGVPVRAWNAIGAPFNALLPGRFGVVGVGDKAHKLAACLRGVRGIDDLYLNLVSAWRDPAGVVRGESGANLTEPLGASVGSHPNGGLNEIQLQMMFRDSLTYLPDDILCKVDRAAMAASLETRVPFLDHRVAEVAWRLPLDLKIRGSAGKWALRQVLYKYVPQQLIDRPKVGFGIPVGDWLRGPLRPWAEDLLTEQRLEADGFFSPAPVRQLWREHLSLVRDHTPRLWAVLMFQAWLGSQHTGTDAAKVE